METSANDDLCPDQDKKPQPTSSLEALADLSDGQLLQAFREGQQRAFAVLFSRHRQPAIQAAMRKTNDPHQADDAAHEAFANILAALRSGYGPSGTFTGYLHTSVYRELVRIQQQSRKEIPVPEHQENAGIDSDFTEALLARTDADSRVLTAFKTLPERWQQVLWQVELNGHKPAEIAPHFGLSPNALVALHRRAKEGLRKALAQSGEDDSRRSEPCPEQ